MVRLGIFVTHPIQYFAPLWRLLAATPGIDLTVFFFSDTSVRGGIDSGFGVSVAWDVPVLDGYRHEFITRDADVERLAKIALPDARRRITRDRFDAVVIHGYMAGFERQVVRAARASGVRVVMRGEFSDLAPFTGRSAVKHLLRSLYLARFYRRIDAFCYPGANAKSHLERLRVPPAKLFFSPYSIDTELFEAQIRTFDRNTSRRELGIEEGQVALLFTGKLIPRKAALLLVEALSRIPRRENVVLFVVGDGEERSLVEAAGRRVLGERLRMAGFVNQSGIGRYLAAADIFVLPSHHETWGLVVNEAMQFSLPAIVSTHVGCHRDLIVPGETGMVFDDGDADSLAACLAAMIEDPERCRRMGRAARERVAAYSTEASAAGIRRALGV